MTAKFYAILTNQGAAMLANAAALGTKLNLTQMAIGDANGALPVPDPAQTKLINQKRIAPLNMLSIDPQNASQIVAEQVIPENEGGFWIREIGLFDDGGVLIAVANCPETYKPQLQEGSGRTQTIRMALIVSSTAAVTLKIDPSVVLATRQYVDDKVIEVKAYADDLMKKHVAAENPHTQYLQSKNNLSEVADKAKARGSLGLGSAALKNTGTSGDAVPLANGANTWSAKQTFSGGAEGALTGNASTATKLQTARKIGGVAFDGSADINLPGVNAAGNQATSGNAGSATKLQTARKIGGVAFDGTKDISLPGVNTVGNQATSGNSGSATKLQTARKIGGATFDGTADISTDTLRQNLGLGEGSTLPIGVPVPWPTATPPSGWLMCDGSAFDKAKYPKLALAYPLGKLPDLRGEFIRGWDNGRGADPDRQLLSWQKGTLSGSRDDNNTAIDISYLSNGQSIDYGGDKPSPDNYDGNYLWYASIAEVENVSRTHVGLVDAFFTVTRPRNIAFNYIVKAS
ncbi:phage tail protein [Pluralibacter gergoviae]|uniref:phage tail-collar fiber domain-containing protein n=1 Tax=Pluralibacter gergoviae TaxID=61647 RepID=UPI002ED7B760